MIMKQRPPQKIPELLAPGGDGDCVKAALLAGADAVYCGLPAFNARQRAENIALKDLGALVLLAHQRNCRIYLTLNTLILEKEFDELFELVNKVRAMGIDAVIVQDLGLCFFLKNRFPALEVHASTQMTTHNAGQIAFLSALNVSQVNLSRELSLSEIKALCDFGKNMSVGSFCPRGVLHLIFRPMLHEQRHVGSFRQSGRVRSTVPARLLCPRSKAYRSSFQFERQLGILVGRGAHTGRRGFL
jgi:hypothetical protein